MSKNKKSFLYPLKIDKTRNEIRNALMIVSNALKGLKIDYRISDDNIENRVTYHLLIPLTIIPNIRLTEVEFMLVDTERKSQTVLLVKFRYELKSTAIFKRLHFYIIDNQYLKAILIRHLYRFKKDVTKWL